MTGGGLVRTSRAPFLLVAAVVATLPLGNLSVGPAQVVQVTVALAVAGALTTSASALRLHLPPWQLGLPLAALLVSAALSSTASPVPDVTFRLNVALVTSVLLVVVCWEVVDTPARLRTLVTLLAVAGAVVGLHALTTLGDLTAAADGSIVTGRLVGIFSQPNELGLFAAMVLPPVVALSLGAPGRRRLLAAGCAVVLAAALVLSLSRGAWFGGTVGVAVLLTLHTGRIRLWRWAVTGVGVLATATIVAAPAALVGIVGQRLTTVTGGAVNPFDERGEIRAEAWRQILESPWVGHGPGAYPLVARSIAQDGYDLHAEHAHSLVLVALSEYGVLGLLALTGLATGLLWLVWRRCLHPPLKNPDHEFVATLTIGLMAGLTALVAHGFVDYPLRNPVTHATAWLLIALSVAGVGCAFRLSAAHPPTRTLE